MSQTSPAQLLSSLSEIERQEWLRSLTPEQKAELEEGKKYFTGIPCKHGHISLRRKDGHCCECRKIRAAKRNSKPDVKDYMRKWRASNVEKCRQYEKNWRETFPDRNKARSQNRRAREYNAEGFHTEDDILKLRETQKECQICQIPFSKKVPATVDHIIALASGGSNWPTNLQLLCRSCNSAKGSR